MKTLMIWGCGGHGRVVLDTARASAVFDQFFFFDDSPAAPEHVDNTPLLKRPLHEIESPNSKHFVIAIGDNRRRAQRFSEALAAGFTPALCIHPSAVVSPSAVIAPGTVVMARAVVQAGAHVGRNCIVNTAAIVEHDCTLGDHVHLSSGVTLGGGVRIGHFAHLGLGAVALPGSAIGEAAVVGAGAVVLREVKPGVVSAGVPARFLRQA